MGDGVSSSSTFATSLMNPVSNARIGMHREVYEAAEHGYVGVLRHHNNWKQEKTSRENNVLHVHLGKPLQKNRRDVVIDHVCMSFILYVVDETTEDSMLLQSNDNGDTPLHLAARFGHRAVVTEFLTLSEVVNAGLLNKANKRKDTALHDAARAGHADIVMMLVEAGGENALQYMPNNLLETPLFLAAETGCFESFNSIFEHTDLTVLEHKGPCGQTALHLAVLQKVGETRLVVAALIATVSFTAGFTLPGGFDQSPGETIGLAVLVKKASFIVFLISNTIAFTLSSLAVICYFVLPSQTRLMGAKSMGRYELPGNRMQPWLAIPAAVLMASAQVSLRKQDFQQKSMYRYFDSYHLSMATHEL